MVWLIATVAFFFTIERARGDDSSCWEYKDDCDYRISGGRGLTGFKSSFIPSVHGDRVVEFFDSEDLGGLAYNEEVQEGWTFYNVPWVFTWNDENPPRYFTGWSSEWFEGYNDRRYRVRSRAIADGWTVEDCAWSDTNDFFDIVPKNIQASTDKYAFGVRSEVKLKAFPPPFINADRKFSFYFCKPVPPPPPPSPPPGADITDLVVTIDNPAKIVADKEFNFNIKVSDSACEGAGNNCFGTPNDVDANTGKGLKCEAFVKKSEDATCDYSNAGTHAPCMKWDNFYDENKRGET